MGEKIVAGDVIKPILHAYPYRKCLVKLVMAWLPYAVGLMLAVRVDAGFGNSRV